MSIKKSLLQISDLSFSEIDKIFHIAKSYLENKEQTLNFLRNKIVINLFFENSTRTLFSFEIASKSAGAHVITLPVSSLSISKGESIADTISTLSAMRPDFIIVRSQYNDILNIIAKNANCHVINAGNGSHEHPTQALIDYFTIRYLKNRVEGLNIAICGDILHSRVARSNIKLLSSMGTKIRLVGLPTLMCHDLSGVDSVFYDFENGINGVDVIMLLRMQKERMCSNIFIPSEQEYSYLYLLNKERLSYAKHDVIVMHPGPMNRDLELSYEVADKSTVVLDQVKYGVAVRKAILHYLVQCD